MVNYVVLGGGVAGVTCAEELSRLVGDGDQIYLLSQSRILKIVTNVQAISKTTETFDLVPTDLEQYRVKSNFHVLQGAVTHIDRQAKTLVTNAGTSYRYDKLCIATGARPRTLVDHPHVVGIRDIESVDALCSRLSAARRIMVVGNGGIALELLNEIRRIPIVWAIKDAYLGNTFLDAGASTFFMPHLFTKNEPTHSRLLPPPPQPVAPPKSPARPVAKKPKSPSKRRASTAAVPPPSSGSDTSSSSSSSSSSTKSAKRPRHGTASDDMHTPGASLGPVWRASLVLPPPRLQSDYSDRELVIETQVTVTAIWGPDDDDEANGRAAKRPTPTSATHDDAQAAAAHAAVPRLVNPIEFVPDLTRFGEGRLGVVPRDEMRPGEVAVPFPPSAHLLSPSAATGATPPPIQTRADEWPLYVRLSNGKVYGVDLLVSATGVVPNAELAAEIGLPLASSRRDASTSTRTSPPPPTSAVQVAAHVEAAIRPTACDGGILVDKGMRTADPDIYAAGDCVTCAWNDQSPHWFQMRLWSQARLMGLQAARSMVRDTALASNAAVAVPAAWPATATASPPSMASPLIPPAPGAPGAPPTPFSPDLVEAAAAAAAAGSPAVSGSPPLDLAHVLSSGAANGHAAVPLFPPPPASLPGSPALIDTHSAVASSPALGTIAAPPPVPAVHSQDQLVLPDGRILPPPLDVHFSLFAHVSRFFGFKVVLLGLFNAQGLAPGSYDVMVRSSHPGEYVKVVKDRATRQLLGAMLIGETELEEVLENLILTRADVSFMEEAVLEPDMDLDAPVFAADGHGQFGSADEEDVKGGGGGWDMAAAFAASPAHGGGSNGVLGGGSDNDDEVLLDAHPLANVALF